MPNTKFFHHSLARTVVYSFREKLWKKRTGECGKANVSGGSFEGDSALSGPEFKVRKKTWRPNLI